MLAEDTKQEESQCLQKSLWGEGMYGETAMYLNSCVLFSATNNVVSPDRGLSMSLSCHFPILLFWNSCWAILSKPEQLLFYLQIYSLRVIIEL